jgi:hypothetical protein
VPGYGTANVGTACSSQEGFPCAQQIGRGNSNSSDPLYIWSNTGSETVSNNPGATYYQSGRDYYLNAGAKPGYVAYTYPHPLVGGSTPSVPVLTSPIDNATAGWPVDFTWQVVTGAIQYHIQVDNDVGFGSPEVEDASINPAVACDVSTCHFYVNNGGALAYSTHYYWRVRALH